MSAPPWCYGRKGYAWLTRRGLGKTSVARKLSAVRSFLRQWVRDGHMEASPADAVPNPKQPKHLPRDLSVDQVFPVRRLR